MSPTGTTELYRNDVKVIADKPVNRSGPQRMRAKRGDVTKFTGKSRKSLLFIVRNFRGRNPGKLDLITLTYPPTVTPENGEIVKHYIVKLRKWLVSQSLSGVWVIEFHQDGRPHIHMVLNGFVEILNLRKVWGATIGAKEPRVNIKPDYGQLALADYLAKRRTKTAPASFGPVGRFWAQFGPAKVVPESTVPLQSEAGAAIRNMLTTTRKAALVRKGFPDEVADEWSNREREMTGWGLAGRARSIAGALSTEPEHNPRAMNKSE